MSLEYKAKTIEQHQQILINCLPKGDMYLAGGIENKIMNIYLLILAKIYTRFDAIRARMFNDLNNIYAECIYLDRYWEELDIGRFIDKPLDKQMQANIIKFYMKARTGVFTATQMENLINESFGISISITILNFDEANINTFDMVFDFMFVDNNPGVGGDKYTVLIKFPKTSEDPSNYYNREDPYTSVKELLKYLININYKIIYDIIE